MSVSHSQPETKTQTDTTDKRIATGDGGFVAQDGGQINIESLDAGLAEEAMRLMKGLAENSNDSAFSLSKYAMDVTSETGAAFLKAFADKDEREQEASAARDKRIDEMMNGFRSVAEDSQTTMRDALATVLGSDTLAGSASQSGSAAGWISRNPLMAAVLGIGALFLVVFGLRSLPLRAAQPVRTPRKK